MKKRILAVILTGVLAVAALTGCGTDTQATGNAADNGAAQTVLKVGANLTPHAEILREAKNILAKDGIDLEVVEIEDVVTPNTGVAEGTLDANFFQHQPYLDDFNSENGQELVSVGTVHYEPFAIYAGKTKNLSELPDGAEIAVPNNVTNEARALLLLQDEGIIKLREGIDITATVTDIVENPKNISIKEIDPAQLVRSLSDVDVAVINGNYALEGGLHVKDALAVESDQSVAAKTYANIVAVRKEEENNTAIKKLVEVLQGEEIKNFITEKYEGAVIPIS